MPVLLNGFSEEGLSPFPGQDSLEKFSQALTIQTMVVPGELCLRSPRIYWSGKVKRSL